MAEECFLIKSEYRDNLPIGKESQFTGSLHLSLWLYKVVGRGAGPVGRSQLLLEARRIPSWRSLSRRKHGTYTLPPGSEWGRLLTCSIHTLVVRVSSTSFCNHTRALSPRARTAHLHTFTRQLFPATPRRKPRQLA